MAIYRAVGQNTYKFVTETNFTLSQDLTVPNRAYGFPMIKYYSSSNSSVLCGVLYPSARYSAASSFKVVNQYAYVITNASGSVSNNNFCSYKQQNDIEECTVDGNKYYGTKSPCFVLDLTILNTSSNTLKYYIKPVTYKVVKYQASSGTIVIEEYTISSEQTLSTYSASSGYYSSNWLELYIPKQSDDIILAIETTFPEESGGASGGAN